MQVQVEVALDDQEYTPTPEQLEKGEEIKTLMEENNNLEQELHRGTGFQMDVLSGVRLQLAALLDVLCPPDTTEGQDRRLEVDLRFQQLLNKMLTASRSTLSQVRLTAGGLTEEDIKRMAAAADVQNALIAQARPGSARRTRS